MKLLKFVAILSFLILNACGQEQKTAHFIKLDQENLKGIWLDQQAASWYQAFPIGNGRLGGMVYGGTEVDTIKLNEETLWSGEPRNIQNKHGLKDLPKIRQLLADKKTLEAQKLIDSVMLGPNNQSYLPMGDLILKHNGTNDLTAKNYKRVLDLNNGLVTTTYNIGDVNYKKEVFASKPDDAIIVKITGDKANSVNFTAELYSLIKSETNAKNGDLALNGQVHPVHAFPHYEGPKEVIYENGKGMRFQIRLSVIESDGRYYRFQGWYRSKQGLLCHTDFNGSYQLTMVLIKAHLPTGKMKMLFAKPSFLTLRISRIPHYTTII